MSALRMQSRAVRLLTALLIAFLLLTALHNLLPQGTLVPLPAASSALKSVATPPKSLSTPPPPVPLLFATGPPDQVASTVPTVRDQRQIPLQISPVSLTACMSKRLRDLLSPLCGAAARDLQIAADAAADSQSMQAALHAYQHPADCSRRRIVRFKDWRNGLGSQLSSLVGAWAAQLEKPPSLLTPDAVAAAGNVEPLPVLLIAAGGLRYANKALCPRRDLSCYFEPFTACEAPEGVKTVRAAKMRPELAGRWSDSLRLRRRRDKWWVRMEMTKYIFRPHAATKAMLVRVRHEMRLLPPATMAAGSPSADRGARSADSSSDLEASSNIELRSPISSSDGSPAWLRIDQLVAVHVRRGDKKDLGARERGEPFSDAMYVRAALALADEVGATGFLLASSEPSTLARLPQLLAPRPTYLMPAKYFVQVPEGMTPHMVVEKTQQEGGENDEGRSQIVQLLLLSECRAFLGTVTSNFGLLVTKLMAFRQPTPVSLDLSCKGLTSMRTATDEPGEPVWPIWDELAEDARRSTLAAGCRGQTASKFPGPAHRLRKRLRDVVPY